MATASHAPTLTPSPTASPSPSATASPSPSATETASCSARVLASLTETQRIGQLFAVGLADDFAVIDSPVGPLRVAWNGRGVSEVAGATDDATFQARFHARTGRVARRVDALPADLARKIERRLAGDRHNRIDLDLRGSTPFEQAVWMKALEIPRGEVRPYGWIAAEIAVRCSSSCPDSVDSWSAASSPASVSGGPRSPSSVMRVSVASTTPSKAPRRESARRWPHPASSPCSPPAPRTRRPATGPSRSSARSRREACPWGCCSAAC